MHHHRALFAKANVPEEHRCLKEYEGAFHDLLHELDPTVDAFLGDIVNWITVRLDQMRGLLPLCLSAHDTPLIGH